MAAIIESQANLQTSTERKIPFVYFLCTGNSCRSQMAEGFARFYGSDQIEVRSAGIEAHGLNLRAVEVMKEVGVDISAQRSKRIQTDLLNRADLVITLCGDARDKCPTTPPHVERRHWGLPDPAQAEGSEEEVLAVFRHVRDEISERVRAVVRELREETSA